MAKFCGKCGAEVKSDFCTSCGAKVDGTQSGNVASNEANEYFREKMKSKRNHNVYRITVGIIMIVLGFLVFVAGCAAEDTDLLISDITGINLTLAFIMPGLLTLAAGILSIISKKVNVLLLISAILYILSAIFNAIGIENISILLILNLVFAGINIAFFVKTLKNE